MSSLLPTPLEFTGALLFVAWGVWIIARALRVRRPESMVARCRKCMYPVPTAGPNAMCPECGSALAGVGTLPPSKCPGAPPRPLTIALACLAIVGACRPFLLRPAERLIPTVTDAHASVHVAYRPQFRAGFKPPGDGYTPRIDLEIDFDDGGGPVNGTMTIALDGDLREWPSVMFDVASRRVIKISNISQSAAATSPEGIVRTMYEAAGLDLTNPDYMAHATQFGAITASYLARPNFFEARPEELCDGVRDGGCLTYAHAERVFSGHSIHRLMFGHKLGQVALGSTVLAVQLALLAALAVPVYYGYRRARRNEAMSIS